MEYNVYIGYDAREHDAAEVCKYSIVNRISNSRYVPAIHYLKSENIPEFTRPREPTQSTDFTYTRFMIPFLESFKGFSIFCDCDFLFLADINELMDTVDPTKAVSVVRHPHYVPLSQIKMDGIVQHNMWRKNWASLIVFNNEHLANKTLSPFYVNSIQPGRALHQFGWLQNNQIGSISLDWNTLDGYYELDHPKAIHYTEGGPWFANYTRTHYARYWVEEYNRYKQSLEDGIV